MNVSGVVEPGFQPVRAAFEENFERRGDVGAACCVYVHGRPVVDLFGGTTTPGGVAPYGPRTLQMVASCTKGALAVCAHLLVQRGQLDLDEPVATYWPEFAAAGKAELPVRYLLSHQAGLPATDHQLPLEELLNWPEVCSALAATAPLWEPGTKHGYHALTYGWLVGEVVARIAGMSPGQFFAREVAAPLGLDLHIGLDATEHSRVAPLIPVPAPPPGADPDPLTVRMRDPASLAHRAFFVDTGLFAAFFSDRRSWTAEIPSANGMGTAHALARMYAACVGPVDGIRLLSEESLAAATVEQASGMEEVSGYDTRYALGFQLPFPYRPMAGAGSFGHYGLGGSVGFAQPALGFSFGYTVNQMGPGVPADPRSVALIDAVVRCVA
jgi:CubicO group peptidase (beta-lactamase class C family)